MTQQVKKRRAITKVTDGSEGTAPLSLSNNTAAIIEAQRQLPSVSGVQAPFPMPGGGNLNLVNINVNVNMASDARGNLKLAKKERDLLSFINQKIQISEAEKQYYL